MFGNSLFLCRCTDFVVLEVVMMSSSGIRLARFAAVFCLVLVLQGIAYGQRNRISGQVFGADRRPIPELYVELLNEVSSVLQRTRTNGGGNYFFTGMSAGRFTVRVRPFGTDYEEQSQEVDIVNIVLGGVSSSDSQQRDFYLRPKRDASKPTGSPGVVFVQDVPKEAQREYEKAIIDLDTSRVDAGILELENAINIFPDYFMALDRLGVEFLKLQKFPDAKKIFERAVAVNTKSANSWYGLAFVLYSQNLVTESIEAAKKAVALAPESPEINLILGIALRKGRQYTDAEKSMLKAKKLSNGKSADVHWNLALLYTYNLKDNRLAANELESYLKIKPDHPDAERLRQLIRKLRTGT